MSVHNRQKARQRAVSCSVRGLLIDMSLRLPECGLTQQEKMVFEILLQRARRVLDKKFDNTRQRKAS